MIITTVLSYQMRYLFGKVVLRQSLGLELVGECGEVV